MVLLKTSNSNMKLGSFLLLVILITFTVEVQELLAAVRPQQLLGESRQKTVLFFE